MRIGKTMIALPAPFDTKITVNHEESMKSVVYATKQFPSSRFLHLSRVLWLSRYRWLVDSL